MVNKDWRQLTADSYHHLLAALRGTLQLYEEWDPKLHFDFKPVNIETLRAGVRSDIAKYEKLLADLGLSLP